MRLAILMTNTDESTFAQRHPKDGAKFTALVHLARPDWQCTAFNVKDGVFPTDITACDGIIITGSPASVHDTDDWVGTLLQLIRDAHAAKIPMFGACYGHQAIALALGGTVEDNPQGWVFGLTRSQITDRAAWMTALPAQFSQYGAHIEAVTKLPKGARVLTTSDACDVTGYAIGNAVYTTQNHPEMTPDFIAALVTEYTPKLPTGIGAQAAASLTEAVDLMPYAQTIAAFFEQASAD